MNWRSRGRERQAYSFTYDFLDRLTAASYFDVNDAGTATASSRYNETLSYADKRGNIASLQRQGAQLSGACWNFAQIDNLTYTYTAGTNKISSITDAASATYKAKGFNPGGGTGSYAYDVNGNMTSDPYKSMTIGYNHLNLPKTFTFTSGAQSNTIDILYDAAGTKLRKTVKTGPTVNYTQDYLGGIEYRDGVREAIYTAEGRVRYFSGAPRYEYTIKDHLGNARISFSDLDNNGVVNETSNPATNEVLQENHYYPFGLNMDGPWMNDAILDNKYQYNGKEFNDDFGLNLNDYGARWYDASVGRWVVVDGLADDLNQNNKSPYAYAWNNPVNLNDPDGNCPTCIAGAVVGGIAGGLYGFFSSEGTLKDRLKNAGKKALGGAVAGAIIGTGVGIAAFVGAGTVETGLIIGAAGGIAGASSSIAEQSIEIAQGEREHLNEDEVVTDMLIGIPSSIVGGAAGGAAESMVNKEASKFAMKNIFSNQAKRAIKEEVKRNLTVQGVSKKEMREITRATTKALQNTKVANVESVRLKMVNGVATTVEVLTTSQSDRVDNNYGDENK